MGFKPGIRVRDDNFSLNFILISDVRREMWKNHSLSSNWTLGMYFSQKIFMRHMLIDLCHSFNGALTKSPLKSERGWIIISQYFVSTLLFICALLSVNLLANGAHGPLTRYVKLWLRIRRERFPCHRGLAIPTCITARDARAVMLAGIAN